MGSDHISSALSTMGVQAEVLGAVDKRALIVKLRERLRVDVTARAPWDNHTSRDGQLRTDGWELIPKYVGDTPCLMFLDGATTVWKFRNGYDLLLVLRECPAPEFYVCDQEARYLLCSNHHDFLIGWGAAERWVDDLGSA